VDAFRQGEAVSTEEDLRAQRGAYFVNGEFTLLGNQRKEWHQVMDVNQEITAVIALREALKADPEALWQRVADDVARIDSQFSILKILGHRPPDD